MRLVALLVLALVSAGCFAAESAPPAPVGGDASTDAMSSRVIEKDYSGTILGTPAQPGTVEFKLDVPTGAVGVNATLEWADAAARLALTLIDPDGEVAARGVNEKQGRITAATEDRPRSGTWTLRVTSTLAVNAPFKLKGVAELIVPEENVVRQTTQLRTFNEVNVIMEANDSFTFAFQAGGPVQWDVHSHPGSEVKYWQQGEDAKADGAFTAPERGIYSLLFRNKGVAPVDLTFEMKGRFRLHSHAQ